MSKLGTECLILLDGFDEMRRDVDNQALESPLLSGCFVIVTTRPHKVDEFCQSPDKSEYGHIRISGFTSQNSEKYINKFFDRGNKPSLGRTLIEKVGETPILQALSSFPILLVMVCLLWEDSQTNNRQFQSMTGLYEQAVMYLNKPFEKKCQPPPETIDNVLIELGKPALEALFENMVQISGNKYDLDILEKAFDVGLTIEEEGALRNETYVTFVHKTFQEFCAAKYLAHLFLSGSQLFDSQLRKFHRGNMYDMEYVLQFCCGLCTDAAQVILHHVVGLCTESEDIMESRRWSLPMLLLYEADICNQSVSAATDKLHVELNKLANYGRLEMDMNTVVMAFLHFPLSHQSNSHMWFQNIECVCIKQCKTNINRIFRSLGVMKCLKELYLSNVECTVNPVIIGNDWFKSLKMAVFMGCSFNISSLSSLLTSMPPTVSVQLAAVVLTMNPYGCLVLSRRSHQMHIHVLEILIENYCFLIRCTLMKLLDCMPSVTSLRLHTFLDNLIDKNENTVYHDSIKDFHISDPVTTNIDNAVSYDFIKDFQISGPISANIDSSVSFDSIKDFQISGQMSANTMVSLLGYMPSVKSVELREANLTGDVDKSMAVSYESLTNFKIDKGSLSADTMMILLRSMPSAVASVKLDPVKVFGDVDENLSVSFKSFTELEIKYDSLSPNMREILLGYVPSLSSGTLDEIKLFKANVPTILTVSFGLQTKFAVSHTRGFLREKEIMSLLDYISSVASITIDEHKSLLCVSYGSQIEFMLNTSVLSHSVNTIMRMLSCMPSVRSVSLHRVVVVDEINEEILASCESLEEFHVVNVSWKASILMTLLSCMPSVTSVTLNKVRLVGEIDRDVSASCDSVQEFQMSGSLSPNAMIRLLNCLPSIALITLDKVTLVEEIDVGGISELFGRNIRTVCFM